ncbi:MAG: Tim44 domain-containing protein [Methylocystaceae bacterium]|nr:Tim44 domain-containing protein [Methylocystaceae bacterium]
MANFDLILLALIAVFIFLRLRSVLGSKDGNEENRNHRDMFDSDPLDDDIGPDNDNVIHLPGANNDNNVPSSVNEIEPVGPVQQALADIMAADANFDQHGFVEGARGAFEMILTAFAGDDRETLKNLLTEEVYQNFEQALDARKAAGETLETTLIGIKSIEITDAALEDKMAEVTLRIVSEQVNVTKDAEGAEVDGDSNYIDTITDIWTFERDISSRSPNWYLKATQTE